MKLNAGHFNEDFKSNLRPQTSNEINDELKQKFFFQSSICEEIFK